MDKTRTNIPALLDAVLSGSPADALRASARLRRGAARRGDRATPALLEAFAAGDRLARTFLVHPVAAAGGHDADRMLARAVTDEPRLRAHAAWALGERPPAPALLPALAELVAGGGFGGMVAGLTLERWYATEPAAVTAALWAAEARAEGRARERLRDARGGLTAPPVVPLAAPRQRGRLRVVQVLLQGRVDAELSSAGAGDGGGLATLLVQLSRELARLDEVEEVVTVTRAFAGAGADAAYAELSEPVAAGARIERIPFGPPGYVATSELWEHRAEIERELAALLARLGPVDAVHLRFADAGTLAAARVSARAGIPIVFTLAPDPHVVIEEAERAGELDRDGLAEADATQHYVFRARLVEWMLDHAHRLALLPRAGARPELRRLLGLPLLGARAGRVRTVPEGISLDPLEAARAERAAGVEPSVVADLRRAVDALPPARRGLPVLLSVGRLHPVKGFPSLVEAWAGDPELWAALNLVVVGGDLERPTPTEEAVLAELALVAGRAPGATDGLVLLGHRPHADVARLLVAARAGVAGAVAPSGVYACASRKEEFGLALLEALAAGLPVVGPDAGGPPTFVEDGVTGFLTETASVPALRRALRRAAAVRHDAERAALAAAAVRRRHTIGAMARGLASLYEGEAAERVAA